MDYEEPIILKRKMYYNKKEKDNGEGFYPYFIPIGEHKTPVTISFKLVSKNNTQPAWIQNDNSVIYGFEGITGSQLLVSLNNELNKTRTRETPIGKTIINSGGRQLFPPTANSTYRILNNIPN